MEEELEEWICPECVEKRDIPLNWNESSKLGICPACGEYRRLCKKEAINELDGHESEIDQDRALA